jgi:hypothetical protein
VHLTDTECGMNNKGSQKSHYFLFLTSQMVNGTRRGTLILYQLLIDQAEKFIDTNPSLLVQLNAPIELNPFKFHTPIAAAAVGFSPGKAFFTQPTGLGERRVKDKSGAAIALSLNQRKQNPAVFVTGRQQSSTAANSLFCHKHARI